jgi:hypothetical protein
MLACLVTIGAATQAYAQAKSIPGERRTVTATVQSVDMVGRTITLRTAKGEEQVVKVPDQVTRLSEIKPGNTIRATYYDNIVLRLKAPTEADVDTLQSGLTPGTGPRPVGTSATQRTITALVDNIDLNEPSISFKGPRGWTYSTKVQDKKALEQVKVGDRVDITWTEATLVSVIPANATPAPVK